MLKSWSLNSTNGNQLCWLGSLLPYSEITCNLFGQTLFLFGMLYDKTNDWEAVCLDHCFMVRSIIISYWLIHVCGDLWKHWKFQRYITVGTEFLLGICLIILKLFFSGFFPLPRSVQGQFDPHKAPQTPQDLWWRHPFWIWRFQYGCQSHSPTAA